MVLRICSVAGAGAATPGEPNRSAPDAATDEAWEAQTATDSDDEAMGDADFMEQYDAVLADEMRGTKLADSFRPPPSATAAGTLCWWSHHKTRSCHCRVRCTNATVLVLLV